MELEINCLLPPSQHYGAEEAIVIVENFDSTELPLEFSAAQINVLAQSLGGEILRLRHLDVSQLFMPNPLKLIRLLLFGWLAEARSRILRLAEQSLLFFG